MPLGDDVPRSSGCAAGRGCGADEAGVAGPSAVPRVRSDVRSAPASPISPFVRSPPIPRVAANAGSSRSRSTASPPRAAQKSGAARCERASGSRGNSGAGQVEEANVVRRRGQVVAEPRGRLGASIEMRRSGSEEFQISHEARLGTAPRRPRPFVAEITGCVGGVGAWDRHLEAPVDRSRRASTSSTSDPVSAGDPRRVRGDASMGAGLFAWPRGG